MYMYVCSLFQVPYNQFLGACACAAINVPIPVLLLMFCYKRMLTFTSSRWPVPRSLLYICFLFQVPDDLFPAVCFIYVFCSRFQITCSPRCAWYMFPVPGSRWSVPRSVLCICFLFQVPDDLFPAYDSCSRFQMTCSPRCALYMFPVPGSRWPVPRGMCGSQMAAEFGVLSWLRGHVHQGTILTQWILSIPAKCGIIQTSFVPKSKEAR